MSESTNKMVTFFAALGATILAALTVGIYEGWVTAAQVSDGIPYPELGFLAGLLAVVAIVFYLRK